MRSTLKVWPCVPEEGWRRSILLILRNFKYYKESMRTGASHVAVTRRKTDWICHISSICLLKRVTEGKRKT